MFMIDCEFIAEDIVLYREAASGRAVGEVREESVEPLLGVVCVEFSPPLPSLLK